MLQLAGHLAYIVCVLLGRHFHDVARLEDLDLNLCPAFRDQFLKLNLVVIAGIVLEGTIVRLSQDAKYLQPADQRL